MTKKLFIMLMVIILSAAALSEKLVDIDVLDNDAELTVIMEFDRVPAFKTEEDLSKTVFSIIFPNLHLSHMYLPVHTGPLESVRFIDLEKETYVTFYTLLPLKPEVISRGNSIHVKFKKIPKKINLSFEPGMPLSEVVKFLSEYTNLNVIISNEVAKLSVPSMKLHNVSPEDALRAALISVPGVAYSYFPDGTLYVGNAGEDIIEKFNKFWGIYKAPAYVTFQQTPLSDGKETSQNQASSVESLDKSIEYFSENHPESVVEYLKRKSIILVYGGPAIHSKVVELLNGKRGFEVVKVKNPSEASRILSEIFDASITYMEPDKVILKGDFASISRMKEVLSRLGLIGEKNKQESLYKTINADIPEENQDDFLNTLNETADFVKSTTGSKELSITYYPSLKKVIVISDSEKAIQSAFEIISKFKEKYKTPLPGGETQKRKIETTSKQEWKETTYEAEESKLYSESLDVKQKIDTDIINEIKDYVSKDENASVTVYYYPNIGKLLIKSFSIDAIRRVKDILNTYMQKTAEKTHKINFPSSTETFASTKTGDTTAHTTYTMTTTFKELSTETEIATMVTHDVTGEFDYEQYISFLSNIFPDLEIFPLKNARKIIFIGKEKYIEKAIDISSFFKRGKYIIKLIAYPPDLPIESIINGFSSRFPSLKVIVIKPKNYMIVSGSEEEIDSLEDMISDLEAQLSKILLAPSTFTDSKPATDSSKSTFTGKIITMEASKINIDAPGVSLGNVVEEFFRAIEKSIIFVDYPEETVYLNVSGVTLDRFKKILELYGYNLTVLDNTLVLKKKV
ncbi:MAG: hypothetical protein J7L34_03120, partial [Thermotogaceae bacterium]|nr:hypothetical protein [Thermotogaceae bacterium]